MLHHPCARPNQLFLRRQKWIIRVSEWGFAVASLGTLLVERSMQPYAFDQVRVCNIFAAEGDEVSQTRGNEFVGVFGCDADIQDHLAVVNLSKVMNHCVVGKGGEGCL